MSKASRTMHRLADQRWRWPIDFAAYDRSPHLTREELAALDRLILAREKGASASAAPAKLALHRLVQPLADALDVIGARHNYRTGTITVICRGMQRQRSSFWSWTEETWAQMRPADQDSRRTTTLRQCLRRCVVSLGYLFGGVDDMTLFEHCIHHVLAAKVFGRELVTQALARVSEVIAGWGYSKHAEQDSYYKQTIGKALLINRSPFLEDLTAEVLLTLYQSCTHREARSSTVLLSRVLVSLGVISHPLPDPNQMRKGVRDETVAGISRLWLRSASGFPLVVAQGGAARIRR